MRSTEGHCVFSLLFHTVGRKAAFCFRSIEEIEVLENANAEIIINSRN